MEFKNFMEEELWWKMSFDGRQPLMEENLWWKTNFDGRQPLIEYDIDGRWSLLKDNLCWNLWGKIILVGRRPKLMMNFAERRSLMKNDLFRKHLLKSDFICLCFPKPYLYCESPLTDLDVALHKDQDKMKL